jgi:hypothetical protein
MLIAQAIKITGTIMPVFFGTSVAVTMKTASGIMSDTILTRLIEIHCSHVFTALCETFGSFTHRQQVHLDEILERA